jgi:hypothetical protein
LCLFSNCKMKKNMSLAIAAFCVTANAYVIKKEGRRVNEHPERNAYHPFLGLSEEIDVIHYPDEKAFSVQLTEHKADGELERSDKPKRLQAVADQTVEFTNTSNIVYTAPAFMGTARERVTLLYDTGSPELTCSISTCTGCQGNKYNFITSSWYTVLRNTERKICYYDKTCYTGFRVTDTVCPVDDDKTCIF